MMERVDSQAFVALREALSKAEVELLYQEVKSGNTLSDEAFNLVARVNKIIREVNEDVLKYDIDLDSPRVITYDTAEGKNTPKVADHVVHIGNLLQNPIVKLTAVLIVSSRDDVQGGELAFKHWPDYPRVDNYGKLIKDGDHHQPVFTNEQGTLIVYPSTEEVGAQLCISGPILRVKFLYSGKRFR